MPWNGLKRTSHFSKQNPSPIYSARDIPFLDGSDLVRSIGCWGMLIFNQVYMKDYEMHAKPSSTLEL
jgi:hypothetical protein